MTLKLITERMENNIDGRMEVKTVKERVKKADSNHPLYGKTFIGRGYGKPTRPPETVEAVPHKEEVEKTKDSTSHADKENASSANEPDKDKGGKS